MIPARLYLILECQLRHIHPYNYFKPWITKSMNIIPEIEYIP